MEKNWNTQLIFSFSRVLLVLSAVNSAAPISTDTGRVPGQIDKTLPDLVVTIDPNPIPILTAGKNITVNFQVLNQGQAPSKPTQLKVGSNWIMNNGFGVDGTPKIFEVPGLDYKNHKISLSSSDLKIDKLKTDITSKKIPYLSKKYTQTFTVPYGKEIIIWGGVDSEDLIPESNESNNAISVTGDNIQFHN